MHWMCSLLHTNDNVMYGHNCILCQGDWISLIGSCFLGFGQHFSGTAMHYWCTTVLKKWTWVYSVFGACIERERDTHPDADSPSNNISRNGNGRRKGAFIATCRHSGQSELPLEICFHFSRNHPSRQSLHTGLRNLELLCWLVQYDLECHK